jgi:arsenate reductase (thioredoxin)
MHAQMSPLMRSALDAAERELARKFLGVFSQETIRRTLEDSYERIGDRPTVGPNFMPIFVKRFARERLEAVAQAEGILAKTFPEVLFVCEHNSGRSQMAAARVTSFRAAGS